MEQRFVIAWKAKYRDGIGKGKKLLTREEAEELASELNRDYPEFEHTVAPANSSSEELAATPGAPEMPELGDQAA